MLRRPTGSWTRKLSVEGNDAQVIGLVVRMPA